MRLLCLPLGAYLENEDVYDKVLLKIDFKNAFNTVRRDIVLQLVKDKLPGIYPFIFQCYGGSSSLSFGDDNLNSDEGVQQDDPLGLFLFSLACIDIVKK